MATARLQVSQVGPLVTIQDKGRPGLMRFGVPASGPMDRNSYAIANAAVGNAPESPAIEISLGGLTLECLEGNITVAIAGGGFRVEIDDKQYSSWIVAALRTGSKLAVKPGFWGTWTYLAFAGRLRATSWLGSVSTHELSGFGGRRLSIGQQLVIDGAEVKEDRTGTIACPISARPRHTFNTVLGPQDRFFPPEAIDRLFSESFVLSDAYDRMGARLIGPKLSPRASLDMPSEAIVRGSIQVSGDGVPVVLLADHQTTGGYPKIATIVSTQLDSFVQLRSRSRIRFSKTTADAAIGLVRTRLHAQRQFWGMLQKKTAVSTQS